MAKDTLMDDLPKKLVVVLLMIVIVTTIFTTVIFFKIEKQAELQRMSNPSSQAKVSIKIDNPQLDSQVSADKKAQVSIGLKNQV